jgi:PleD family two-component response regulator
MVPLLIQDWPTAQTGECRMPHRASRLPVNVLLVEDSPNDAELMVEALGESDLKLNVTVVEDGEQAVDYLRRRGAHREARRPT